MEVLGFCLGLCVAGLIWEQWYSPGIGAGIFLLSLLSTRFRDTFLSGLKRVVSFLGSIQTALVLGLVFYLILFPLSLVQKLFKKKRRPDNSNFIERNKEVKPEDFVNMW